MNLKEYARNYLKMLRVAIAEFVKNGKIDYLKFTGTPIQLAVKLHKHFEALGCVPRSSVVTPLAVAKQMVRLGGVEEGSAVVDPAAGFGSLLHAAREAGGVVWGFETDPHYTYIAHCCGKDGYHIWRHNFLRYPPPDRDNIQPDVVLLNPPVGSRKGCDNITSAFLRRIHTLYSKSDPRIIAILPMGFFGKQSRKRVTSGVGALFNVEEIMQMRRWQIVTLGKREVAIYVLTSR